MQAVGLVLSLFFAGVGTRAAARASKEAGESIDIARETANAMKRSAEIADTNLRLGQRAYISATDMNTTRITSMQDKKRYARIVARMRNAGSTPAVNMFLSGELSVVKPDEKPTFRYEFPPDVVGGGVGPGVQVSCGELYFPEPLLRDIQHQRVAAYILANCHYDDVFGHPHVTQLCVRVIMQRDVDSWFADDAPDAQGIGFTQVGDLSRIT